MKISKIQYVTYTESEKSILSEVKTVLESGINWIQLNLGGKNLDCLVFAKQVKELTDSFDATLIITDKVEIAKQIDAHGVCVELTDVSIQEARAILGDSKIIGGNANSFADAKNVELFGADYIVLGPYKHTTTKKVLSPVLGLKGYQEIIPKVEPYGWKLLMFNVPIIAQGGIEVDDVKLLKETTGVYGVALTDLIKNSDQKTELIKELNGVLD